MDAMVFLENFTAFAVQLFVRMLPYPWVSHTASSLLDSIVIGSIAVMIPWLIQLFLILI